METGREAEEKRIQIHIFPTFNYQNLYQNSRIRTWTLIVEKFNTTEFLIQELLPVGLCSSGY